MTILATHPQSSSECKHERCGYRLLGYKQAPLRVPTYFDFQHIKMATSSSADSKSRILLNDALAVEIYKCKLALHAPSSSMSCFQSWEKRVRGQSARVSPRFGVSPKTIRDIWNHKTWVHATCHLWMQSEYGFFAPHGNPSQVSRKLMQVFGHNS